MFAGNGFYNSKGTNKILASICRIKEKGWQYLFYKLKNIRIKLNPIAVILSFYVTCLAFVVHKSVLTIIILYFRELII